MIIPIGKAAIIETDCKPYMEFSAKRSPIGRSMKIIAHKSFERCEDFITRTMTGEELSIGIFGF